jgi:hypothetical protein
MTLVALPRPNPTEPQASVEPHYFAPTDAFRVLQAWRAWGARRRDCATSGFVLVRGADGTVVLASDDLSAAAVTAIGLHSRRRLNTVSGPAGARAMLAQRSSTPALTRTLRTFDDWGIELLLRTAAALCHSLTVGVRHCAGRYELIAWVRRDAVAPAADMQTLMGAMSVWIEH